MNDTSKKTIALNNLTFLERLWIPEILRGMWLVLKRMFETPKFTRQYPEERWTPTASYRGRPVLVKENGTERCVACGLCARICPAVAITVQATETNNEKERCPQTFEIDMLRCSFCGLCEEVCPEEAIVMGEDFELVFQTRSSARMDLPRLLISSDILSDRLDFLKNWK